MKNKIIFSLNLILFNFNQLYTIESPKEDLDKSISSFISNQKYHSDFKKACEVNDIITIKNLLKNKDGHNLDLKEPLLECIKYNHKEIFELLVKFGFKDIKDLASRTLLINLCLQRKTKLIKILLEAAKEIYGDQITKEYIDLKDHKHRTALMTACKRGYLDVVKLLVSSGANTDLKDKYGFTAFTFAMKYWHEDILKYLKEAGANFDLEWIKHIILDKDFENRYYYKYAFAEEKTKFLFD